MATTSSKKTIEKCCQNQKLFRFILLRREGRLTIHILEKPSNGLLSWLRIERRKEKKCSHALHVIFYFYTNIVEQRENLFDTFVALGT